MLSCHMLWIHDSWEEPVKQGSTGHRWVSPITPTKTDMTIFITRTMINAATPQCCTDKTVYLEERQEVMTPARPRTLQVARMKFSSWTHNIPSAPGWSSTHCFNGNPKQPVNKQNLAAESTAPAAQWWTNESRFFRYENWGEKKTQNQTQNQTNQGWWKKESPRHHANRLLFLFPSDTAIISHSVTERALPYGIAQAAITSETEKNTGTLTYIL